MSALPEGFQQTFEGRLAALARADRLASARNPAGSLDRLLEDELRAAAGSSGCISLLGPAIALHPDSAYALSLIIHELATNAAKHGALSSSGGRVDVRWNIGEAGELVLTWVESDGPPVRWPHEPGVGGLLITYAAAKLNGSVDMRFRQAGFHCTLRVSLSARWPHKRRTMSLGKERVSAVRAM